MHKKKKPDVPCVGIRLCVSLVPLARAQEKNNNKANCAAMAQVTTQRSVPAKSLSILASIPVPSHVPASSSVAGAGQSYAISTVKMSTVVAPVRTSNFAPVSTPRVMVPAKPHVRSSFTNVTSTAASTSFAGPHMRAAASAVSTKPTVTLATSVTPVSTIHAIEGLQEVSLDIDTKKRDATDGKQQGDQIAGSVCGGLSPRSAEEQAKINATSRKKLSIVAFLCLCFMIGEVVGGVYANSLAILTDAAHLFCDLIGFFISVFAVWLASQPATAKMSFGFHRAEILGAIVSCMLIWLLVGILLYEAVLRVISGTSVDGKLMFAIACAGLGVNLTMGFVLHSPGMAGMHAHSHGIGGHSHGDAADDSDDDDDDHDDVNHGHNHAHAHAHAHGHAHGRTTESKHSSSSASSLSCKPKSTTPASVQVTSQGEGLPPQSNISGKESKSSNTAQPHHTHTKARRGQGERQRSPSNEDVNVRAAFIHVLGDCLQSVGVIIASALIWYNPDWRIADPICTFLFSIVVLTTTIGLMRQSLGVLMEATPDGIDSEKIEAALRAIPGVSDVHDLHLWSISVGKISLSTHLRVGPGLGACDGVLQSAHQLLVRQFHILHSTIQVEATTDQIRCNKGPRAASP